MNREQLVNDPGNTDAPLNLAHGAGQSIDSPVMSDIAEVLSTFKKERPASIYTKALVIK